MLLSATYPADRTRVSNRLYSHPLYLTSAAVLGWTFLKCPAERKAVAVRCNFSENYLFSMELENKWDSLIIESLKANKLFKINQVNNFEHLLSSFFDKELYAKILNLIKAHDWEALKSRQVGYDFAEEFLDVIKFSDQDNKVYVATIYDSNALKQDPQLIDIISLDTQ